MVLAHLAGGFVLFVFLHLRQQVMVAGLSRDELLAALDAALERFGLLQSAVGAVHLVGLVFDAVALSLGEFEGDFFGCFGLFGGGFGGVLVSD